MLQKPGYALAAMSQPWLQGFTLGERETLKRSTTLCSLREYPHLITRRNILHVHAVFNDENSVFLIGNAERFNFDMGISSLNAKQINCSIRCKHLFLNTSCNYLTIILYMPEGVNWINLLPYNYAIVSLSRGFPLP